MLLPRVTVTCTVPAVGPRVTFALTWPAALEVFTTLERVAEPCVTPHVTVCPEIGLLQALVTVAWSAIGSA